MGTWTRVEDDLPVDSGMYLVVQGGAVTTAFFYSTGQWGCNAVTHWMPLPAPPQEAAANIIDQMGGLF